MLVYDIIRASLCALVVLLLCDGRALLHHVSALFLYNTWEAVATEIAQHKLLYFGNVCCYIFVDWVARRIHRHGRTAESSETSERQLNLYLTNRLWRHVKQSMPGFYNKPVLLNAHISCELGEDDPRRESRGIDKDVLLLKGEPPCAWPYNQGVSQKVTSSSHSHEVSTSQFKQEVKVTEKRCKSDSEKLKETDLPEVEKGVASDKVIYIVEHEHLSQREAKAAARQKPNPLKGWGTTECILYRQPNSAKGVQEKKAETDVRETKSCDAVIKSEEVNHDSFQDESDPAMPVINDNELPKNNHELPSTNIELPSNGSVRVDRVASSHDSSLEDIDGSGRRFEVYGESYTMQPTTSADVTVDDAVDNTLTNSPSDYRLPSNTDHESEDGSSALYCLFLASCLSLLNPDTLDGSFADESNEDPRERVSGAKVQVNSHVNHIQENPESEFNPLTSSDDSLDAFGTDSSSNGSSGWDSDLSNEPSFSEHELPLVEDLLRIRRNQKQPESSESDVSSDILVPEQELSLDEDLLQMPRGQNLETLEMIGTPENSSCFESEGRSGILVPDQELFLDEDWRDIRRKRFVFPADFFKGERLWKQKPEQPILTTESKVLLGVGIFGIGSYVCWKYFK